MVFVSAIRGSLLSWGRGCCQLVLHSSRGVVDWLAHWCVEPVKVLLKRKFYIFIHEQLEFNRAKTSVTLTQFQGKFVSTYGCNFSYFYIYYIWKLHKIFVFGHLAFIYMQSTVVSIPKDSSIADTNHFYSKLKTYYFNILVNHTIKLLIPVYFFNPIIIIIILLCNLFLLVYSTIEY